MTLPVAILIDDERAALSGPRGRVEVRDHFAYDRFAAAVSEHSTTIVTVTEDLHEAAASPGLFLVHGSETLDSLLGRLTQERVPSVAARCIVLLALPREISSLTEQLPLAGAIEYRRYDLWRADQDDDSDDDGFYGCVAAARLSGHLAVERELAGSGRYASLSLRDRGHLPKLTARYLDAYQVYLAESRTD